MNQQEHNNIASDFLMQLTHGGKTAIADAWKEVQKVMRKGNLAPSYNELALEMLIEKNAPIEMIKILFEHNEDNNRKNENLFKWACGHADTDTVKYLEEKNVYINQQGAINATIINHKLDNFKYLVEKNYPVFISQNFSKALARVFMNNNVGIIKVFIANLDKIEDLSDWDLKRAKELMRSGYKDSVDIYFANVVENLEKYLFQKKLDTELIKSAVSKKQTKI